MNKVITQSVILFEKYYYEKKQQSGAVGSVDGSEVPERVKDK